MAAALSGRPGTSYTKTVTDAAEVQIVARSYCSQIVVWEMPDATGWPRNFKCLLPAAGSSQVTSVRGSTFPFYGPFQPEDIVGTIELSSAGGDTSTFAITEIIP